MDFFELTNEYYAYWLGVEKNLLKEKGVFFFESQERDKQQIGYPQPFHLVIYITEALIIVSYSQSLESQIQDLSKTISNDI